jgi:malate synthase
MNARFALNAANARWGSLYDALYGTDVISEEDGAQNEGGYNPVRGDKVIEFAKNFLDETIPLDQGSFKDILGFKFVDGNIQALLPDIGTVSLKNPSQYIGYKDNGNDSYDLLFKNNNLHFEIQIDPNHPIGQTDKASIKDILMESAITTIQDCEDSVAAVDGEDKTAVYRNWLGLMKGDLKNLLKKMIL